jgi:hypothetical protein
LKHGLTSGSIIAQLKWFKQTATVELQSTDLDPASEASWGNPGMYNKSRIELKGFFP